MVTLPRPTTRCANASVGAFQRTMKLQSVDVEQALAMSSPASADSDRYLKARNHVESGSPRQHIGDPGSSACMRWNIS